MEIRQGAPPLRPSPYGDAKLPKQTQRLVDGLFPTARLEVEEDESEGKSSFVVFTSYGERASMTLSDCDLPVRLSNVCPFLPRYRDLPPDTASGSLVRFLVDAAEFERETKALGVPEYDYVAHFESEKEALAKTNRESNMSLHGGKPFDQANEFATSIASKDLPTPNLEHPDTGMVLVGDMAQIWDFCQKASRSLQHNILSTFYDMCGKNRRRTTKEGEEEEDEEEEEEEGRVVDGSNDDVSRRSEKLKKGSRRRRREDGKNESGPKRTRDAVLFCVADMRKAVADESFIRYVDYTKYSRNVVLSMTSVHDVVRDAFLSQLNTEVYKILSIDARPVFPGSPFYGVNKPALEDCLEWQKSDMELLCNKTLSMRHWSNLQKFLCHARERLLSNVLFHFKMSCAVCNADVTDMCTAADTHRTLFHCGQPVLNLSKFVTTQSKGSKSNFSLNSCRAVKMAKTDRPTCSVEDDNKEERKEYEEDAQITKKYRKLSDAEKKQVFERPCHLGDRFPPFSAYDAENHRETYPKVAYTLYVVVPFDREATLEHIRKKRNDRGMGDDVRPESLVIHNARECRVPLLVDGKLVEYVFEVAVFRFKINFSVQGKFGDVDLFDPGATTKRYCPEMRYPDGRKVIHGYEQRLQYCGAEKVELTAPLLNLTNFKRHRRRPCESGDGGNGEAKDNLGEDNFTEFGKTFIGAMVPNFVNCGNYEGDPLVPQESFGIRNVRVTLTQKKKDAVYRIEKEARKRTSTMVAFEAAEETRCRTKRQRRVDEKEELQDTSNDTSERDKEELDSSKAFLEEAWMALASLSDEKEGLERRLQEALSRQSAETDAARREIADLQKELELARTEKEEAIKKFDRVVTDYTIMRDAKQEEIDRIEKELRLVLSREERGTAKERKREEAEVRAKAMQRDVAQFRRLLSATNY